MFDPLTLPTPPSIEGGSSAGPAPPKAAGLAQSARFGAVLRGAAKGLGCASAELWLLDNATSTLFRHAHWESNPASKPKKKNASRRRLADAEPDLAALAGGAVVLENPAEVAAWNPHREAAAAMCLPVSSDRTIHGVVWFFASEPQRFDDTTVELAEIVGGRLAVERERDALLDGAPDPFASATEPVEPDNEFGFEQADALPEAPSEKIAPPTAEPLSEVISVRIPAVPKAPADEIEAAGWVAPHAAVGMTDQLWLPDGRLVSWCATVVDPPTDDRELLVAAEGAARSVRDAAREFGHLCQDPGELLRRMGEPLWTPGASGDGFALALAMLEASEPGLGGRGAYATAGPCLALRVRAAATNTHTLDGPPLGWDPDAGYAPRPFELQVRERLVLVAGDPRLTSPLAERSLADVYRAATASAHREMTAEDCLARLKTAGCDAAHAATAIRRV